METQINKINDEIEYHQNQLKKLIDDRSKLIMAQIFMIKKSLHNDYLVEKTKIETRTQEPIEIGHPLQCQKETCKYCRKVRYCRQCDQRMFCQKKSKCHSCGRGGRRLDHMTGSGLLILTIIDGVPCLSLIQEKFGQKEGTIGDIGGCFDPDLDDNMLDTIIREVREESGLIYQGTNLDLLPQVYLLDAAKMPTYRMYLIENHQYQNNHQLSVDEKVTPESVLIHIPVTNIDPTNNIFVATDGKQYLATKRIIMAFKQKLINGDMTLFELIQSRSEQIIKSAQNSKNLMQLIGINQ